MSDAPSCRSFESVLDALLGDAPAAEAERARAHLAACPACSRLLRLNDHLLKNRPADTPPVRGTCPPVEILAAYAAGGPEAAGGEAIDAHLAACPACREAVGEGTGEPSPVPARLVARARSLFRDQLRPVSAGTARLPQRLSVPVAWMLVPLSAAAGLLGGVAAVRWFSPEPPPRPETPAVVRPESVASADAVRKLARRQEALESRADGLERRMAERSGRSEETAADAKALAAAIEALRKDFASLDASVKAMPAAPAAPAVDPKQMAELTARLDRAREEIARLGTELASVREAHRRVEQTMALARRERARQADRMLAMEEKLDAATAPDAPPPDFAALLAAVRRGEEEAFRSAIGTLEKEGLSVFASAVAYYDRDAPKERRAAAGEALTRRGAKGVDHDLILALAHGEVVVRREASALLTKNRTRGMDFGFLAAASAEDRLRALNKAVRWWENEYRADFPEKALIRQGGAILIPGRPVPVGPSPGATAPDTGTPAPTAPPPQYDPTR